MNLIHKFSFSILLYICVAGMSCSKETSHPNTSEFILEADHTIEVAAYEPTVILPVAMVEDRKKRFWIVEMPGYMRDIDGNGEDIADGRIVILSDSDKDGIMEDRSIFLDSLLNPRALCLVYNGLLFTDGTQLKWTEIQDDKPKNTIVVDSFYVVGGNIEHQPNGLIYNIDNWIYSAKSNARYRRVKGKWIKEATTFRGQWGISMDENGNLIYNHNSAPIMGDYALPNQILDNPYLRINKSNGQYLTDDMRVYPIQATSVNRGYQDEVLDSTGKLIHYTSACAPHIFYGSLLSSSHQGSAFVCAPEANVVANYSYGPEKMTAEHRYEENEFLVSTDETFRPVNLHTGFDGALYVVDMRKGIIQHSAYMSSYLRDNITKKGLEKVNGKGRIYKVSKKEKAESEIQLDDLMNIKMLGLLNHSNLQVRMYAQKHIIANYGESFLENLMESLETSEYNHGKIHSLWTMEGLGLVDIDRLQRISELVNTPEVFYHVLAISKTLDHDFEYMYEKAFQFNSKKVDFLLASIIGRHEKYDDLWQQIAARHPNDHQISEALVSSSTGREAYFVSLLNGNKNDLLINILGTTIENKNNNDTQSPKIIERPFEDDRTNGFKKFKLYCASCHRLDGKGQKNVAPSLKESLIIQGEESKIASAILNGYTSENSEYQMLMPAYKEDKNLTDQDIFDLISYLKSTYTEGWNTLSVEEISELRKNEK